jgi:hypothetical protein
MPAEEEIATSYAVSRAVATLRESDVIASEDRHRAILIASRSERGWPAAARRASAASAVALALLGSGGARGVGPDRDDEHSARGPVVAELRFEGVHSVDESVHDRAAAVPTRISVKQADLNQIS